MTKEDLIKKVETLISESDDLYGSFLYHYCLDDFKRAYTQTEFESRKKKLKKYAEINFDEKYQKWYSKTLAIIKIVLPGRQKEFELLYRAANERKQLTLLNYTISDAIRGMQTRDKSITAYAASDLLKTQINIVKSLREVLESRLNEIKNLLEFDVFEKEIDSARYLLKNKYVRSAGAICGVIIEKHLVNMLAAMNIVPSKKNPTINDLNEDLYKNDIIDLTQYKYLQYLGDIRNKCDHNKSVEPTKEEVEDLINGTDKIIKSY